MRGGKREWEEGEREKKEEKGRERKKREKEGERKDLFGWFGFLKPEFILFFIFQKKLFFACSKS